MIEALLSAVYPAAPLKFSDTRATLILNLVSLGLSARSMSLRKWIFHGQSATLYSQRSSYECIIEWLKAIHFCVVFIRLGRTIRV